MMVSIDLFVKIRWEASFGLFVIDISLLGIDIKLYIKKNNKYQQTRKLHVGSMYENVVTK